MAAATRGRQLARLGREAEYREAVRKDPSLSLLVRQPQAPRGWRLAFSPYKRCEVSWNDQRCANAVLGDPMNPFYDLSFMCGEGHGPHAGRKPAFAA
jgi:hypothetical protein